MASFLNPWDENNITLSQDLGHGRLLTQGGDFRYVANEPQRSVLFGPVPKEQEDPLKGVRTIVETQNPLAYVNVPVKPVFPAVNKAPEAQQLEDAERELQEEKEADERSGSEGYEKKPDGVFDRLKGWGTSVGEYLFGKDNRSEVDKLADKVIQDAEDAETQRQKEEQGVLGYYGRKALGQRGSEEWEEFKRDWDERGLGAVGERAGSLLNDMARSPFARFVDPTTVLGGQRTMVNDIDSYFDKRGIGAVRDDILKQDMLNDQTLLGQARQYANATPEERAAIDQYMQMRYPSRAAGSLASVKNEDNMRAKLWNDFYAENGRAPYADEWDDIKRIHGLDEPAKATTPKNLNEFAIGRALDNYRTDPERYDNDPNNALTEQYDTMARNPNLQGQLLRQGSYQPKTANEKVVTAQREGFAKAYAPRLSKELEEVESDTYNETLRDLVSFYAFLNDPRNANYLQGPFNNTIQGYASKLGIASKEQEAFLAAFLSAQRNMHAVAIRQINQSGATNREEQRKAAESIIDMSKGLDYNKSLVEKTISNMALAQAMKRDEYYLAEAGGDKRSNDALLRKKYGAMIHDPNKYIDPAIVNRYLGEDGVFAYSPSVGSYVFGTEE